MKKRCVIWKFIVQERMKNRSKVIDELESRIDRVTWGNACGSFGNFRVKALALGDILSQVCVGSVFGWYGDGLWCFNGRVYERISVDEFRYILDGLLTRMCVGTGVRVYMNDIVQRCLVSIRMEGCLRPRFDLMAFGNGVVDVWKGELMDFSPEFPVLYEHGYMFEKDADCPKWKDFLRRVLPERSSRLILQMFMGVLVTDRRRVDVPFALAELGTSAYGKSVVNEVMRMLFGTENISNIGVERLLKTGDSGKKCRTGLVGKRLNYCTSLDEDFVMYHENEFWDYLDGRNVLVRYSKDVEYELESVPWQVFNFNKMLLNTDLGSGVLRRLVYLIFEEYVPDAKANYRIGEELREELPGILNWCVKGAKYARSHEYRFPSSTNSERERILSVGEDDSMKAWLMYVKPSYRCRYDGDESRWIRVRDFYSHYLRFCKANRLEGYTIQTFGRRLTYQGFTGPCKRRGKGGFEVRVYGFTEEDELNKDLCLGDMIVPMDREFEDITEE